MAARPGRYTRFKARSNFSEPMSSVAAGSLRLPILIAVAAIGAAGIVSTGPSAADEAPPERFRDVLGGGSDWSIAMPELQSSPTEFDAAIRAGNALSSEAYLGLDRALRRVTRRLELDPADPDALAELDALRQRLRSRVEVNVEAGYLYAAGVYIELLRIAGADALEIRRLTAMLRASRD